ncbi:manganese efflux pump MntP family protein [Elusimicrobiota bacterium]
MNIITILLIAVALAMDSFAVAIACGIIIRQIKIFDILRIASFFALFQGTMPIAGWLAGIRVRALIAGIDHWVAFGLLAIIGARMIYEALKPGFARKAFNPLHTATLLVLSIATSIDALAAGLSLAILKIPIVFSAIIIAITTFIFSFIGVRIGKKLGAAFERKVEIFGGAILISIGVKILLEHLR